MKPTVNGSSFLLAGLLLLLTACDRATPLEYDAPPEFLCSIARLKTLCDGQYCAIADGTTVRGTVTGNNRYGEFYCELVIQDATGGLTVAADYSAADNPYPLGEEVTVYCNGLTLYDYGGKIELGKITGENTRIPHDELHLYLRTEGKAPERVAPCPVRIGELTAAHADTYVRLDDVHFVETGSWCDRDPLTGRAVTTERTIADAEGRTLKVRTLGSALYANEPLPEGSGSLCGIIDCFGGVYALRITGFETAFAATPATPPTACL